jgi:hypothetical protein
MRFRHLTLIILLISLPACRDQKKIIIRGEITGEIPEKLEYTVPVHGVCNYGFKDFVQPDSLGKFKIEIETEEEVFIKLMINNVQGTLISEPGKSYNVRLDLNNKETPFSVSGKYSSVQEAYNKLPSPVYIQIGAGEFLRDTLAVDTAKGNRENIAWEYGLIETHMYCKHKHVSI